MGRNYFLIFEKFCKHLIKMEMQKILNLLNSPDNEYSRFATKKNSLLLTVNQKVVIRITIQERF